MLRHYLNLAVRLLRKERLYTGINVIGLAIAFSLAALIFLFVRDEYTYDDWHDKADRIYRIDRVDLYPDGAVEDKGPWLPYPFADALRRDHPLVERTVRMIDDNVEIRVGDAFAEQSVLFVDSTFFDVFTHTLREGSLHGSLADPGSIVLTETAARRHFGHNFGQGVRQDGDGLNVVGRTLELRFEDGYLPATVTAVIADPQGNTNIPFEYLLPFHRTPMVYDWIANRTDNWNASSFIVFALLSEGADESAAQATLSTLWRQYYPDRTARMREQGRWEGEGDPATYDMIGIRSLHLDPTRTGGYAATSDPQYAWILMAIGFTILALACINFTILAIGRGSTRAAEIGVRKAMGARRGQLMAQFAGESTVLSILAMLIGVALARLLLPVFNSLSGKELTLQPIGDLALLACLLAVALITGLVAGWYPSLVISRHRPAEAIRGRHSFGGSNPLTKALVVTQFAASIVLVAGALIMHQQLRHIQTTDIGYDPDNVLVVHSNGKDGRELVQHLRQTVGRRADVAGVAAVSFSMNRGLDHRGWVGNGEELHAYVYNMEPEALDLLDVELIAGRGLDARLASDSIGAALINEAFAADLGFTTDDAVGQKIPGYGRGRDTYIIGVVRDLNFRSLRHGVEPMMIVQDPDDGMHYSLLRIAPSSTAPVIAALTNSWASFAPDIPLEYTFLDDDVALEYRNDQRWGSVVRYAALLAILIACMGLFGLAALTVSRRTKEIGVRKVLGASVTSVLALIARDFVILVAIAAAIAAPVAYIALNGWLEGFAYHVTPSAGVFVAAGAMVLAIAMLTVSVHSIRAATANPVDALRYE